MNIYSLKKFIPVKMRKIIKSKIPLIEYYRERTARENPYLHGPFEMDFENSPYKLCIIKEILNYHKYYISACMELKVSFRVLDITKPDWLEKVKKSECDAFLVWPSPNLSSWRKMFDDRLYVLEKFMGKIIYPSYFETWFYEDKHRLNYFLEVYNIPHPKTWVFYLPEDAMNFVKNAKYPLVLKTSLGASASGVTIVRSSKEAIKLVRKAFTKGLIPSGFDHRDRQFYKILIQEYLPDVEEWRVARVGYSYVGYRKEKKGDFHSGSGKWSWLPPPVEILNMVRDITERFGITSMSFDIFRTKDGKLLVNEMQTVFGASKPAEYLKVNGKFGRYIWDEVNKKWVFEEGEFCRNHLCNLRVEYLINHILPKKLKKT